MKSYLIAAIAVCITSSVFAQNLPIPLSWKIKKFSVSMGIDQDMIKGMDANYLMRTVKNPDQSNFSDLDFKAQTMYGGICENPHFRVQAVLEVPGMKNTELNLGVNAMINRIDGAYYSSYDYEEGYIDQAYSYLSVETIGHELGLESSIVKRLPILNYKNTFGINLYGGVGTNLGYSFGGKMSIDGLSEEAVKENLSRDNSDIIAGNTYSDFHYDRLDVKDSFNQRAFAQIGVGVLLFKRVELGIDYKRGIGYRATFDGPTKMTQLNSLGMSAKWVLK